jgi:hypothetical protein
MIRYAIHFVPKRVKKKKEPRQVNIYLYAKKK